MLPAILNLLKSALAKVGGPLAGTAAFTAGSAIHIGGQLGQVLVIFLFFLMIRVFFTLAKSYLTILLLLVLGPIMITFGAISGAGPIRTWFLTLLANILVFPVIGFILTIGQTIQAIIVSNPPGAFWSAPYIGIDRAVLSGAIGMGMLLLIPEVPNLIQAAIRTQFPEVVPMDQLTKTFQQLRPPSTQQSYDTGQAIGGPLGRAGGWIRARLPF